MPRINRINRNAEQRIMKFQNYLNLKNVVLFVVMLSLTSCFDKKPLQVQTTCEPKQSLNMPEPNPLKMTSLKWYVVTPETQKNILNELSQNNDKVIFGLTAHGYKLLSNNIAELQKYIIEERFVLKKYKEYYEVRSNRSAQDNKK